MITVPRLAKGHGYKGPEFFGCYNTGLAPAIFHCYTGKWVVGPELRCRDAMRNRITLTNQRSYGEQPQKVWIFKSRAPAVSKFLVLCGARIMENEQLRQEVAEKRRLAARGDLSAALALGDYV